jgi:hypothetical protein
VEEDISIILDWEPLGLGTGTEGGPDKACGCRVDDVGGDIGVIADAEESILGRNVELISPIPTKKSSGETLTRYTL